MAVPSFKCVPHFTHLTTTTFLMRSIGARRSSRCHPSHPGATQIGPAKVLSAPTLQRVLKLQYTPPLQAGLSRDHLPNEVQTTEMTPLFSHPRRPTRPRPSVEPLACGHLPAPHPGASTLRVTAAGSTRAANSRAPELRWRLSIAPPPVCPAGCLGFAAPPHPNPSPALGGSRAREAVPRPRARPRPSAGPALSL